MSRTYPYRVKNPYEPQEPDAFRARARAPQRRGADYHLPPIGNVRMLDQKHLARQEWIGRGIMLLLIGGPIAYALGLHFNVW